ASHSTSLQVRLWAWWESPGAARRRSGECCCGSSSRRPEVSTSIGVMFWVRLERSCAACDAICKSSFKIHSHRLTRECEYSTWCGSPGLFIPTPVITGGKPEIIAIELLSY